MRGRREERRRVGVREIVEGERKVCVCVCVQGPARKWWGLLTLGPSLGRVGGVGLAMMDLTRGLACGFTCRTFYEEVSHAWRD